MIAKIRLSIEGRVSSCCPIIRQTGSNASKFRITFSLDTSTCPFSILPPAPTLTRRSNLSRNRSLIDEVLSHWAGTAGINHVPTTTLGDCWREEGESPWSLWPLELATDVLEAFDLAAVALLPIAQEKIQRGSTLLSPNGLPEDGSFLQMSAEQSARALVKISIKRNLIQKCNRAQLHLYKVDWKNNHVWKCSWPPLLWMTSNSKLH